MMKTSTKVDLTGDVLWKRLFLLVLFVLIEPLRTTHVPWQKRCLKWMVRLKMKPEATARLFVFVVKQGIFYWELAEANGDFPIAAQRFLGAELVKRREEYVRQVFKHFERIGQFEGVFEA